MGWDVQWAGQQEVGSQRVCDQSASQGDPSFQLNLAISNMYVEFLDSYGFPKQFRNIGFKFKYLPLPIQPRIPNSHITIWYLPGKFDIEMWVFDIFQELLLVFVSYWYLVMFPEISLYVWNSHRNLYKINGAIFKVCFRINLGLRWENVI